MDTRTTSTNDRVIQNANSAAADAPLGPFIKGVVVEVISDPLRWVDENIDPYLDLLKNEAAEESIPRGSVLVKLLDEPNTSNFTMCYPFFQSHLMLPVKVGEQVWIYDDGQDYMYWMSRIAGSGPVEDVNFTHKDREFISSQGGPEDAVQKAEAAKSVTGWVQPTFNNGGGQNEEQLPEEQNYEVLLENTYTDSCPKEPIPRWTPRPGDLVLQGSNNTLISLGTDRGWNKNEEPADYMESNSSRIPTRPESGTIDIVVGRGAGMSQLRPSKQSQGQSFSRTQQRTIENTRGTVETDKNTEVNNITTNMVEGDPDFESDVSRIYCSMSTDVDVNFALAGHVPPTFEMPKIVDQSGPAIALKSQHIRVISKEDGSIRLIKESEKGARAIIAIEPDGRIHITGEKIYLGKSNAAASDYGGDPPAENGYTDQGGVQPYVKWVQLSTWMNKIHETLASFASTLGTHTTPGYGQPSSSINGAASTLAKGNKVAKDFMSSIPSNRIFGE